MYVYNQWNLELRCWNISDATNPYNFQIVHNAVIVTSQFGFKYFILPFNRKN